MDNKLKRISEVLTSSDYHIFASGWRDLNNSELVELCKLLSENPTDLFEQVQTLFKYSPLTIELDKGMMASSCSHFDEELCHCFHPNHKNECYYNNILAENKIRTRRTAAYDNWRRIIFERDSYTCSNCNKLGGELNAHHIKLYKDYPELRLDINNGITLCYECHRLSHRKKVNNG